MASSSVAGRHSGVTIAMPSVRVSKALLGKREKRSGPFFSAARGTVSVGSHLRKGEAKRLSGGTFDRVARNRPMPLRVAPLPVDQQTSRPSAGANRLTVVLPWDLDASLAAFPRRPQDGQLLVLETRAKVRALPFHRQKLTMLVSALRHFVAERRAAGFHVEHRVADDYATGVTQFMSWSGLKPDQVHATMPREWAIHRRFRDLGLHLHDDGGPGGHFFLFVASETIERARRCAR